jgi:hypothetical protein
MKSSHTHVAGAICGAVWACGGDSLDSAYGGLGSLDTQLFREREAREAQVAGPRLAAPLSPLSFTSSKV